MIDKIAWLHLHDGQLLSTRSRGKDRYYLPGASASPAKPMPKPCYAKSRKS
jgi:8-oxo-dGTP diphosphatase